MAITDEPKKRNALGAIAVGAALAGAVWYFIYSPTTDQIANQRQRLEALEAANRQAQLTYARGGGNIEEQLALYERHVMQLEELIPASEEVSGLIRTIQSEARVAGVELPDLTPEGDQPGTYYTRQSYSMGAVGEYHDVGRFFTAIASLPRIITPVEVDISRFNQNTYPDMDTPIQARFRIETYVLPEGGQGPPPAEMGGQGGDR